MQKVASYKCYKTLFAIVTYISEWDHKNSNKKQNTIRNIPQTLWTVPHALLFSVLKHCIRTAWQHDYNYGTSELKYMAKRPYGIK